MARSLYTGHSLYTNLIMLVGVEDDNATVKNFVTDASFSLPSKVTIVSGNGGYVARLAPETAYDGQGQLNMPATVDMPNTGTIFIAYGKVVNSQDQGAAWGTSVNASAGPRMRLGGNETPKFYDGSTNLATAASALSSTDLSTITFSWERGASNGYLRTNKTSQATGLTVSSYVLSQPINVIHGGTFGSCQCDILYFAMFDKQLTAQESDDLFDSLTGGNAFALFEDPTGGGGTKSLRLIVRDEIGNLLPNETGLKINVFEGLIGGNLGPPIVAVENGTSDASGICTIDVSSSVQSAGGTCTVLSRRSASPVNKYAAAENVLIVLI